MRPVSSTSFRPPHINSLRKILNIYRSFRTRPGNLPLEESCQRCATVATPDPRKQRTEDIALLASARPRRSHPAGRTIQVGFPKYTNPAPEAPARDGADSKSAAQAETRDDFLVARVVLLLQIVE